MSIAALIRAMAEAGAPSEAIAIAVEAIETAQAEASAPRIKAREKKRAQRAAKSEDIDGTVPGLSRDNEGTNGDTPAPSLSSPQTPQQTHPHPKINTRTRGTRIPEDFELPADWRQWAISDRNWTGRDADEEGEAFRDFWVAKPGKDGLKADWPATWRNWCRNSRRSATRRSYQPAGEWVSPC